MFSALNIKLNIDILKLKLFNHIYKKNIIELKEIAITDYLYLLLLKNYSVSTNIFTIISEENFNKKINFFRYLILVNIQCLNKNNFIIFYNELICAMSLNNFRTYH